MNAKFESKTAAYCEVLLMMECIVQLFCIIFLREL